MIPLTLTQYLIASAIVMMGALVQGSVGFGMSMVSAPLLMLVEPRLVPGPVLGLSLTLNLLVAHRDLRSMDPRGLAWSVPGRVAGTLLAMAVLTTFHDLSFEFVFAPLVLLAVGITPDGKRTVLGVSVSLSEAEVHWRQFLHSLIERGLHGVELIVSDAHEGLAAARKACLAGVPWQRCQFHLQQNAMHYVPKIEMRKEVAADLRGVFNATDRTEADRLLDRVLALRP